MSDIVFSGHQPNFIPYLGFFYKMFQSDIFVLDDDVQYSSKEWHNTNFLKISNQKCRVTIPVKYNYGDPINKVRIVYDGKPWVKKLLMSVEMSYGKAPHFSEVYPMFKELITGGYEYLCELNTNLIYMIAKGFGFTTNIVIASRSVPTELRNNDRNIYQCEKLGGTVYYSGVGGKDYNDEEEYEKHGIRLVYSDFVPHEYPQIGSGFIENLSVMDYLFNNGYAIPDWWVKVT